MSVFARIRWLSPREGGRTAPPPGPQYSTVAKFEAQTEEESRTNAWSLMLDLRGTPDEALAQAAVVRFLAEGPGTPTQWLKPGDRFTLFEGNRKVAEGSVLDRP